MSYGPRTFIAALAILSAAGGAFAQQTNGAAGNDAAATRQLNRATDEQGTPATTTGRSTSDGTNGTGMTGTSGAMPPRATTSGK